MEANDSLPRDNAPSDPSSRRESTSQPPSSKVAPGREYAALMMLAARIATGRTESSPGRSSDDVRAPDRATTGALLPSGHREGAAALLAEVVSSFSLSLAEQARMCRLLATLAEHAGDLRMVVDFEREAFALECALHVQQLELALHAMELAARHSLLMLDADIERERALLSGHKLPAPHEAIEDRQRAAAAIEQRLHNVLTMVPPGQEQSAREALLNALALIREESGREGEDSLDGGV